MHIILNMSDIRLNYAAIEAAIFSLLLNGMLVITSKYLVFLVQMHYHLTSDHMALNLLLFLWPLYSEESKVARHIQPNNMGLVAQTCTYSTLINVSTNYIVMCKVYTDVGGISKLYHGCSPRRAVIYSLKLHTHGKPWYM